MNLIGVGGLYAPVDLVQSVLANEPGPPKRILDLGTCAFFLAVIFLL